jgi:thermitase
MKSPHWMVAATVTASLLASCENQGVINLEVRAPERYSQSTTVDISADADRRAVEAQYGGKVVVWQPEEGFAILGSNKPFKPLAGLNASAVVATPNLDAMSLPETVNSAGASAWAGGASAWAGGASAWAGGYSAWAGGASAWAGGDQVASTFPENIASWKLIKLAEGQALAKHLGAGVKVAVIDTGIDLNHPAFNGRLAQSSEWKDFIDGDALPQEEPGSSFGHGTSVAGIVLQVAPNATILPLRVLAPSGEGDTDKVAEAIGWAIDHGAKVINLSLGGDSRAPSLHRMLAYANNKGIFVITSSGNTGDDEITVPATYATRIRNSFSVGSVNANGAKSPFSTFGKLELMAPGERIWGPAPGEQRSYWSGTSMSTPMVSGTLALALAEPLRDPGNLGNQLIGFAQRDEARAANDNTPYQNKLGAGYPNVFRFLEQAIAR